MSHVAPPPLVTSQPMRGRETRAKVLQYRHISPTHNTSKPVLTKGRPTAMQDIGNYIYVCLQFVQDYMYSRPTVFCEQRTSLSRPMCVNLPAVSCAIFVGIFVKNRERRMVDVSHQMKPTSWSTFGELNCCVPAFQPVYICIQCTVCMVGLSYLTIRSRFCFFKLMRV